MKRQAARAGFTMIELLVCISVISILMGILLPAVLQSREVARRMSCQSNLRQLMTATSNFESTHGILPSGTSHKIDLLPFLGETALYETAAKFSETRGHNADANPVQDAHLPYLICPSDSGDVRTEGFFGSSFGTSYQGNAGNGVLGYGFNGVFGYGESANDIYPDGPVRFADILDGLSNTVAFSEAILPNAAFRRIDGIWRSPQEYFQPSELSDLIRFCDSVPANPSQEEDQLAMFPRGFPWQGGGMGMALYTHTLTPNRPSCSNGDSLMTGIYTATSMHPSGVNVAFADGHVEFISQSVDATVWADLGSRAPHRLQFPF